MDLTETDIMSSLDGDFSSIPTGMPLLKPGLYELEVVECAFKVNKAGDGQNLNFKYSLTQPAVDINDKPVNPGFPVFDLISLKPTEKYDPRPKIAEFLEAAYGTKGRPFNPPESHIGEKVMARLSVEKSDQYGDKNRISRYVKKSS